MANSFFQFKQFRVQQDLCAMKVCTDSCVLGAYISVDASTRVLDIGTGTGLLALMVAQRNNSCIDAIEIDENAARQATQNVADSPWAERIRIIQGDVVPFSQNNPSSYDLIICNPPFFSNHMKRKQATQNVAMHGEGLQFPDLAKAAAFMLQPQGRFITLLPPYESSLLEKSCQEYGLSKYEELQVFDYVGGKQIRTIASFSFDRGFEVAVSGLYIKTAVHGVYTDEFVHLLKPYYLYL